VKLRYFHDRAVFNFGATPNKETAAIKRKEKSNEKYASEYGIILMGEFFQWS
jgi:hypothetical protein